jgi:hypothetical protein
MVHDEYDGYHEGCTCDSCKPTTELRNKKKGWAKRKPNRCDRCGKVIPAGEDFCDPCWDALPDADDIEAAEADCKTWYNQYWKIDTKC